MWPVDASGASNADANSDSGNRSNANADVRANADANPNAEADPDSNTCSRGTGHPRLAAFVNEFRRASRLPGERGVCVQGSCHFWIGQPERSTLDCIYERSRAHSLQSSKWRPCSRSECAGDYHDPVACLHTRFILFPGAGEYTYDHLGMLTNNVGRVRIVDTGPGFTAIERPVSALQNHQALTGSRPDDFTSTNCMPRLRKIGLKAGGNAGKAVSTSIGSGFPAV